MKRIIILLTVGAVLGANLAAQSPGTTMYVANKTAAVKSGTGLFAGTLQTLHLGDAVTIVQQKNSKWVEVKTADAKTGWITLASLTSKRVLTTARNASASELALAGKGFSDTVETVHTKEGVDYTGVDALEKLTVSLEELQDFITVGHLFVEEEE
ncbi:MAG: hypothetical protein LBO67_07105 [Spirochaetaceae bacterium]|jgi:uncharacterized protein YgiM (DUF1202 family)|nr:hypothetical protein [Spirochaetaceae bacterium]